MVAAAGNNNNSGGQLVMIELIVMLVSVIVYFVSFLLTMALSRYRELAADRSGAILIGQPSLLASALIKISGEMGRVPTKDLRAAEPFNAFFIVPAMTQRAGPAAGPERRASASAACSGRTPPWSAAWPSSTSWSTSSAKPAE